MFILFSVKITDFYNCICQANNKNPKQSFSNIMWQV